MGKKLRLEVAITFRCNRKCEQCAVHCNTFEFMPLDRSDMSLNQVRRACGQMEDVGYKVWRTIGVIGGEPLLHPACSDIMALLRKRVKDKGLTGGLRFNTNGDYLQDFHPKHLDGYLCKVSYLKKGKHYYMLAAPKDTGQARAPCNAPYSCGVALTKWGYWPCIQGGAIARLFGMTEYQLLHMPRSLDDFPDMQPLCDLCQYSAANRIVADGTQAPTKSFIEAFRKYQIDPVYPKLKVF